MACGPSRVNWTRTWTSKTPQESGAENHLSEEENLPESMPWTALQEARRQRMRELKALARNDAASHQDKGGEEYNDRDIDDHKFYYFGDYRCLPDFSYTNSEDTDSYVSAADIDNAHGNFCNQQADYSLIDRFAFCPIAASMPGRQWQYLCRQLED
ncbi:uncharacterized protein LTR77_001171 [Saxophila tyrrhenica]|uniref:Uncharacterized protein n=1 Tax=Saxophila tyrrhenica TaxID=1690608 RepID=A0AAV9PK30_9PEZI|nr:hypothetical protein LTR77_001171 [Saxophila tyrrhenica]